MLARYQHSHSRWAKTTRGRDLPRSGPGAGKQPRSELTRGLAFAIGNDENPTATRYVPGGEFHGPFQFVCFDESVSRLPDWFQNAEYTPCLKFGQHPSQHDRQSSNLSMPFDNASEGEHQSTERKSRKNSLRARYRC